MMVPVASQKGVWIWDDNGGVGEGEMCCEPNGNSTCSTVEIPGYSTQYVIITGSAGNDWDIYLNPAYGTLTVKIYNRGGVSLEEVETNHYKQTKKQNAKLKVQY